MTNSSSQLPVNPNENLAIPDWVNAEYFEKIIEADESNFDKIRNFTPIAATAPGENYTSKMIRVLIEIVLKDGSVKKTSYILKTALDAATQGAELVSQLNLFVKEKQMYQTILPGFRQLYKDIGVDFQPSPKCLHVADTAEGITLVMEDLKRQNFINVDRIKGLDMAHMSCVLRKLAELHSASAVFHEVNGRYDEMFETSFFSEASRPIFEEMSKAREPIYKKAMHTWGLENVDYYINKMPDMNTYFNAGMQANRIDPSEFNVLNHGDLWTNNIMFNYTGEGEIDQCLFVDFQIGKWGVPAQDLWYLITTSAQLDIKTSEFDYFIFLYHKRLEECLKLLKYSKPIPTLKDLHIMMIKYGFYGVITAQGVMTAILLPTDKDANIDNMMKLGPEGDTFRFKCFSNTYYAKAMCQLKPFFDKKGLLDYNNKN